MNSKLRLSPISEDTAGILTNRLSLIFLWTLLLSIFFNHPSFATTNLKGNPPSDLSTANEAPLPFAQIFVMPNDGKAVTHTISDCDAQNKFMDDGVSFPLYSDTTARMDTLTICPKNPWQTVKVEFTDFDVAAGDTLVAFDGDLTALRARNAPVIGSGSGVGVSKAFGGWVSASCSPAINPSGCLTFVFFTNDDFAKGTGWEAWVSCNDRNITITPPSIGNPKLACGEISRMHTIGAATITAGCGTITNDSTIVRITNASGKICIDTCLSKNQNMFIREEFAIGTYLVTYKLKGDTTKTALTYFAINEPNLVCNDRLFIPLGSACDLLVTPDMILESPCDTIQDTMYYQIKIKDASGKILASGTGRAGDYPTLSRDKIDNCTNNFFVEITRTYYDGLTLPFCNNGPQSSTCTSNVVFQDNTPPIFTKGVTTDTIFACEPNLSVDGLMLTPPKAVDNCADIDVQFQSADKISFGDNCETSTFLVTWRAADACGNTTFLKDTVRVMRPGIDKIVKTPDAILSCGEDSPSLAQNLSRTGLPSLAVGVQRNGKFTPTDTVALSTQNYICNYILTKTDQEFPSSCGQKYFRYWTLLDWCGKSGPVPIDTQLVVFKDTLAPTLNCTQNASLLTAQKIALPPFECSKNVSLTAPQVTDNCDAIPEVAIYTVELLEDTSWWKVANNLAQAGPLVAGTYRVGYRAFDECFEQTKEDSCFQYFVLEDQTKPSAVCQDQLTVSLSNDAARILATDIDAGSWDACGIESTLVRREICGQSGIWQGNVNNYVKNRLSNRLDPTGWGDFVDFSCCDLQQTVHIELLIIDKNGNFNFCRMAVKAEDKIDPLCVSLANQWDYCDNFHNGELGAVTDTDGDQIFDNSEWLPLEGDLLDVYNQKYGVPTAACVDNLTCQELTFEQQYQLIDLECGVYRAKRRYRVRDGMGNVSNWAEQSINIEYRPNWKVTLPVDWMGSCGAGVPEEELVIENGACDLVSYEAYDQKFEIVDDACFKVIRTYHIINWCKYQAGDAPVRINRITNLAGDVIDPQTISSGQYANAAYFTYTQVLKVQDDEAPIISVEEVDNCIENTDDCSATKTFSATATDCNDASTEQLNYFWQVYENNVSRGSGFSNTFNWVVNPNSSYRIKWQVSDQCGNSAQAENTYTFQDCKRPSPYCLEGLAIELGQNQTVGIWAVDFDINSFDNCTPKDKLDFRIWHASLETEPPTTLAGVRALPKAVNLTCDYVGIQTVHIYTIDEADNYDFCITSMKVQDNMGVCPVSGGSISGRIYTEFGAAVQDVEVRVENAESTMMMTQSNGSFAFDITGSSNYTVIPEKNNDYLNGVSTFDLVKITKHILGKEPFTSPYQFIAADVNGSGDISTFDIIQIRKLILNLATEFPDGTPSWRFVDATYNFVSDKPSAEAFPEVIQVNNLNGIRPDLDFIAVKLGDINGSASVSSLYQADSRNTTGNWSIEIEEQQVVAGETVEVVFEAPQFADIEGYQFTLQFDDLELVDLKEGIAKAANFGQTSENRGFVTTSWHRVTAEPNAGNAQLFGLTFKANRTAALSELLDINSTVTDAEAYQTNGTLHGVTLRIKDDTPQPTSFTLAQNQPNPFTQNTTIGFELPWAADVTLHIVNLQGQIVRTESGLFEVGPQQIQIAADDLETGTYYYQLVTPFGTATKKMIVLK
ncbi:MAG: T9SS type A sorting domain-containing protein [Bacteroidota bacterium]